jgi:hypothetical protein
MLNDKGWFKVLFFNLYIPFSVEVHQQNALEKSVDKKL